MQAILQSNTQNCAAQKRTINTLHEVRWDENVHETFFNLTLGLLQKEFLQQV